MVVLSAVLLLFASHAGAAQQGELSQPPKHHEADSMPVTGKPAPPEEAADAEPKPLAIETGSVTIQFGGFAKVDYIQDFDPVGNDSQFKVNSIPVEGDPDAELGGSTNIQAKQTRFTLDVRGDTSAGLVRAYVEGDFFGSGNSFRLRHGYGEWNGLLGGQTWTTFQDISARPSTLDYEGPDAEIFVRQAMIRYTGHPSENLEWAIAVEDPETQVDVIEDVAGSGRNDFPDIPVRVRFKQEKSHIQVAGIVRQLRFVSDDGGDKQTATGWGLNLSGKAAVAAKDAIMGHVAYGSGIGRYVESFGGESSDAVLTPSNDLEPLDVWAFTLGYEHQWTDKLRSTIAGSFAEVDNDPSQPGDAIAATSSAHFNLVYSPTHLLSLGGELMWGERENFDGATGDALRFQFSIQYKFR